MDYMVWFNFFLKILKIREDEEFEPLGKHPDLSVSDEIVVS